MKWEVVNSKELSKYGDEIEKMYLESYSKIGVMSFENGYTGMSDYYPCSAYLLRDVDILSVIMFWQTEYGNKIGLVISASSDIGKEHTIPKLVELLKIPGFYIELSDALEYLVRKHGLDNIKDRDIIKLLISGIEDKDIFDKDDERRNEYKLGKTKSPEGSYLRTIHKIGLHRKALYGLPCLSKKFDSKGCLRKCTNMNGGKRRTLKRGRKRALK